MTVPPPSSRAAAQIVQKQPAGMIPKPYVPSLDTFRTIAALLVIFAHIRVPTSVEGFAFFQQTGLAVDFFFVLSGFVIALNYWEISGVQPIWRYLRSRFARIYPLHCLTLLVCLAFECLKLVGTSHYSLAATTPAFTRNSIPALGLSLLLLNAHGLTEGLTFNGPSWSIGAEATCYACFGCILLLSADKRKRIACVLLAAIGAGILFLKVDDTRCGFVRGLLGFGIGCAWWVSLKSTVMHSAQSEVTGGARRWVSEVNLLSLCLGVAGIGCLISGLAYPGIYMFTLGIIGLCAINPSNRLNRALGELGKGWFGQVSYGVYLWHGIVIYLSVRILMMIFKFPASPHDGAMFVMCPEWVGNVVLLLTIAVVLAVAHVSFRYFENPWRRRLRPI